MEVGLVGFIGFLVLLALGVPLAFSALTVGLLGIAWLKGADVALNTLAFSPFGTLDKYGLMMIPLFMLMGYLSDLGNVVEDGVAIAQAWLSRIPGGIAMSAVAACAMFAAVSGSSVASAAVMGTSLYPQLVQKGCDKRLVVGCIASAGTLAILIPPSIVIVTFGIITGTPIGKLLIAGVLPGLLSAAMFMTLIALRVIKKPSLCPATYRVPWRERIAVLRSSFRLIIIATIVTGGIYSGIFTPSEAAAVGCVAAFIVSLGRRPGVNAYKQAMVRTTQTVAMVLLVVVGIIFFTQFLSVSGFMKAATDFLVESTLPINRYVVLIAVMALFLVLGCFMEALPIMMLTMPFLFPVMVTLGFDPVWFGILFVKNMEIGLVTPPVGLNVFVLKGVIPDMTLIDIFKSASPFMITDMITLGLLVAFPAITLTLPNMMK
ncbi:MAG: TRAP transporter large permease [Chloroflexi bacterium]|nr:TRAP transporter large permease [Chloroflexota bacterium]